MFTITAAAAAITTYLATKLKENKAVADFFNDFTTETVEWIKPIFLKPDGTEKKALEELKNKPDDKAAQQKVQTLIEAKVEDDENGENILKEMIERLTAITGSSPITKTNTINADNNQGIIINDATVGNINTGTTFTQHGNNNQQAGGDIINNANYYGGKPIDPASQTLWKAMLANGKIKQAIEFLIKANENDEESITILYNLLAQYNFNENQYNKGVITDEAHATKRNKLTNALLEIFG